MPTSVRVVRVGGSLFNLPDLDSRIHRWLTRQTTAHHILVAGGGRLVDEIRHWHELLPLEETVAHWMCVDAMSVNAQLLHARLPEFPLTGSDQLLAQRLTTAGSTIFDLAHWLRHVEPELPGTRLPETWDTTSDAIAGRLAIALEADELVLLKSTLPEHIAAPELESLAAAGVIDRQLAELEKELPRVRIVNIRTVSQPEVQIRTLGSLA